MKRVALAALALLALAAVAGVARPEGAHAVDGQTPSGDSITVAGNGSVSATPTFAVLSFGVDSRAATAKAALAANGRDMRQVIAAVKAAGGRDVGTLSVSLSQVLGDNGEPNGFAASNTVTSGRCGQHELVIVRMYVDNPVCRPFGMNQANDRSI